MIHPQVFSLYGLDESNTGAEVIGSGLIHQTWKLSVPGNAYILQKLNVNVFNAPEDISNNISVVSGHMALHHPDHLFVAPIVSLSGETMVELEKEYYRVFPYIDSMTMDVVTAPGIAFEAASQFGMFTRNLSDLEPGKLKPILPGFHDLAWRHRQFLEAIDMAEKGRQQQSAKAIRECKDHSDILQTFSRLIADPQCRQRIMHHDTKISNVLFSPEGKGICVVDLDTVMPGYFFSDVGDMMRTYLSPAGEEEKDLSLIHVREEHYKALVQGYLHEMKDELSLTERSNMFEAGRIMIYMQALRFLTDHLNGDIYYGAAYPMHNYYRAVNQLTLLERFVDMKRDLSLSKAEH